MAHSTFKEAKVPLTTLLILSAAFLVLVGTAIALFGFHDVVLNDPADVERLVERYAPGTRTMDLCVCVDGRAALLRADDGEVYFVAALGMAPIVRDLGSILTRVRRPRSNRLVLHFADWGMPSWSLNFADAAAAERWEQELHALGGKR